MARKYLNIAPVAVVLLVLLPTSALAAKKTQTITVESTPPSPAYVGATYQVKATASSGLPVSVNVGESTAGACSISGSTSGSTVTFKGEGTCQVDFNQAGSEQYEPAPEVKQQISVKRRPQTITFTSTAPSNATVGGASYTVTATASSKLAVSFSSATTTVCTVSGSTVSFVGAGTCTINANQAGNGEYAAAPQVQQSFAVAKGAQTITFTSTPPSNATIGGPTYTVKASGGASGSPVTFTIDGGSSACTISGSTVSFTAAGTCTIDANQAGSANYNPAPQVQQSFAVAKRTQTVTFTSSPPANPTIGGTYAVTATASSKLAVSFSSATTTVCTVSGTTVSFVGAGGCTIIANQAGNAEYEPAPESTQTFAVAKRSQKITITSSAPSGAVVGGATYTVTATASPSELPVSFSSATPSVCTASGETVSFVGAGTCTIDANQAGNGEYEPAPQAAQSFTVKRAQTITFTSSAPETAVVGGSPYTVTATASSGLAVSFSSASPSTCTVSGSTVSFQHAGTCTINANQAGNGEYQAAPQAQQLLQVGKGRQTITITSKAPETARIGDTYTITATGGASGNPVTFSVPNTASTCSVSGSTVKFIGAGTCTVAADQAESADYEAAPTVTQTIAVAVKSQTITFTSSAPGNATVGGPTYTVKASGGASGNPVTFTIDGGSSACTISGSTVSFTAAGTCTIDANQAGNGEYAAAPQVQQSFAVAKGSQTITFTSSAPGNATVGGPTYTVTATASSGLPVSFSSATPTVCTASGSTVSFVAVGLCTIDANQAGGANYEPAPQISESLPVGKGAQTIAFTSSPPNPAHPGGTYTVTVVGGGSTEPVKLSSPTPSVCTVMGTTVSFGGTGECVIDANQAGDANYEAAKQAEQTFTVVAQSTPQVIIVTPPATTPPPPPPIKHVEVPVRPNSSFKVVGASLSLTTFSITFQEAVLDPGRFTWVMTFENGRYGVFSSKARRCKSGFVRLKGKCRPAKILFARGSETVATPGTVTFTVRPTKSAIAAMKNAFKHHRGLPVTALVTFQSLRGGPPASRVQSLIVKGRR
jgi:hypothetical protein